VQIDQAREGEMGLNVLSIDREHLVLDDATRPGPSACTVPCP
jgi:hypothetical protein